MRTPYTPRLLLLAATLITASPYAHGQTCATSGAITTDCTLGAAPTGDITAENATILINTPLTLDHLINDNDSTPDANITFNGNGATVTQNAAIGGTNKINTLSINGASATAGNTNTWQANANITANNIILSNAAELGLNSNAIASADTLTLTNGATLTLNDTSQLNSNIDGSLLSDSIIIKDTATLGTGTENINLGGSADLINLQGGSINVLTLDGGENQIDTIQLIGSDSAITGDIRNFEQINVKSANTLTLNSSVTASPSGTTLFLEVDGANATLNANDATATFATDIIGGSGVQTLTLSAGQLDGVILTQSGDDIILLNGGQFKGTIDMGIGADTLTLSIAPNGDINGGLNATDTSTSPATHTHDTLNIAADITTLGTIDNFERINLQGNTLTLNHSLQSSDTGEENTTTLDLNNGTLLINQTGSIDGNITTSNGGEIIFGADGNAGNYTLQGTIDGANIILESGNIDTNSFAIGSNSPAQTLTLKSNTALHITQDTTLSGALTNAGKLTLGAGTTTHINTMINQTGSHYTFSIDKDGNASQLSVQNGPVTIEDSTIGINLSPELILQPGDAVRIAEGTAPVQGLTSTAQYADESSAPSILWNYRLTNGLDTDVQTQTGSATNQELYIKAEVENTIEDLATTNNNAITATTLLNSTTTDATLTAAKIALNRSATAAELNTRAESLQPTLDRSHITAASQVTGKSFNLIKTRLAATHRPASTGQTGLSAGSPSPRPAHIWGKSFAQRATHKGTDNIAGYDSQTIGATAGIDTELNSTTTLGAAATYARTNVTSNNANKTETNIHAYQGTVYADYHPTPNSYVTGLASVTSSRNSQTRNTIGGIENLTAEGNFRSLQATAHTETGYSIYTQTGLEITPKINMNYSHYIADDYTESGANGANLSVKSENLNALELGIGLDLSATFKKKGYGEYLKPSLHLSYRRDLIADPLEITSQLTGTSTSFKTKGFTPGADTYSIGASLNSFKLERWSVKLHYALDLKEDYHAHQASLEARYPL